MPTYRRTSLEKIEFNQPKIPGVPLVVDDWTLSFRLGFRGKVFWYITHNKEKLYRRFKKVKASGGTRLIHNPAPMMKTFQKQIRAKILLPLCQRLGPHVGAYQVGVSTRVSAQQHMKSCVICDDLDQPHTCNLEAVDADGTYKIVKEGGEECGACRPVPKHVCGRNGVKIHMDLKDFFGSTRRSWVRKYFNEVVGYNHYVSGLLAEVLTVELPGKDRPVQGVPQGGPSSGDICNLVADWLLDTPLLAKLKETGWVYTRYADDLYFSHPENLPKEKVDAFIQSVDDVIRSSGYRMNRKKLHVQRPHKQQSLLGMSLNRKVNIPSVQYRKMRSLLHNCYTKGFETQYERARCLSVSQLHSWIMGKLAYFAMVSPHKTRRLHLIYSLAKHRHAATEEAA